MSLRNLYENAPSADVARYIWQMDLESSTSRAALQAHRDPIITPIVTSVTGLFTSFGLSTAVASSIASALVTTDAVGEIQLVERRPR